MRGSRPTVILIALIILFVILSLFVVTSSKFLEYAIRAFLNVNLIHMANAKALAGTYLASSFGDFVYSGIWKPLFIDVLNTTYQQSIAGGLFAGTANYTESISYYGKEIILQLRTLPVSIAFPVGRTDIVGGLIIPLNVSKKNYTWIMKGPSVGGPEFGSVSTDLVLESIYKALYYQERVEINVGGAILNVKCSGNNTVIVNNKKFVLPQNVQCSTSSPEGTICKILVVDYQSSGNSVGITIGCRG